MRHGHRDHVHRIGHHWWARTAHRCADVIDEHVESAMVDLDAVDGDGPAGVGGLAPSHKD